MNAILERATNIRAALQNPEANDEDSAPMMFESWSSFAASEQDEENLDRGTKMEPRRSFLQSAKSSWATLSSRFTTNPEDERSPNPVAAFLSDRVTTFQHNLVALGDMSLARLHTFENNMDTIGDSVKENVTNIASMVTTKCDNQDEEDDDDDELAPGEKRRRRSTFEKNIDTIGDTVRESMDNIAGLVTAHDDDDDSSSRIEERPKQRRSVFEKNIDTIGDSLTHLITISISRRESDKVYEPRLEESKKVAKARELDPEEKKEEMDMI